MGKFAVSLLDTLVLIGGTVFGIILGIYWNNSKLMGIIIALAFVVFFALNYLRSRYSEQTLTSDTETSQKKTEDLEELQKLFYILLKYGRVSVGEIMGIWKKTYGGDSAFIVYEKSSKFKLKLNDLGDIFEALDIKEKDKKKEIRAKLKGILPEKSPFSMFIAEEYTEHSAPLFAYYLSPFYLLVFPKDHKQHSNELSKRLLSGYLNYAKNFKNVLKTRLEKLHAESDGKEEKEVLSHLLNNLQEWNPAEAILIVTPFSAVDIPLGRFHKRALNLLEKYHPRSLETIKEELTKTILRNLTLSPFLEYAGIHPHKIHELEDHEEEIKAKLGIKQWGELFKVDLDLIQDVFSQYNITEEELEQILNAVEKITEIIERPDRIMRR